MVSSSDCLSSQPGLQAHHLQEAFLDWQGCVALFSANLSFLSDLRIHVCPGTPPPCPSDRSSTCCSCWGWRPMRSRTVVPGLRLQYSWNTSRRLALLCPVGVRGQCARGPRSSQELPSPRPAITLLGHIGQTRLLQGLVIHQVLHLGCRAVHIGVLAGQAESTGCGGLSEGLWSPTALVGSSHVAHTSRHRIPGLPTCRMDTSVTTP